MGRADLMLGETRGGRTGRAGFPFGSWELEYRIHDALNISTDDAVRRHVAIDGAGEPARTKDGGYAIRRLHFLVGPP